MDSPYMVSYYYIMVTHGLNLISFKRYNLLKYEWPWHCPFKVTEVKCNHTNGLTIYAFQLMFNSNIWSNSAPLKDMRLRNLSDLDIELSRSLRSNVIIQLASLHSLLLFTNDIWPNAAPLRDITLQNLSDLDLDLSKSLRSDVIT